MTITHENFTVQPTYELYSQAIKTGIELCFSAEGVYLPFVEEVAVYYPILLYFTNCDPAELTLESCFELIFSPVGNKILNAIGEAQYASVYESVVAAIRTGIETQKNKTSSDLNSVVNAILNKLGGVSVVSDMLLALMDTALADSATANSDVVLEG